MRHPLGIIVIMLVFIDDSGDPGFNFDKGSSIYFALAAVIFDSNESAEETSAAINNLRESLHWNSNREFKFNKSNSHIRQLFLQTIASHDFRIRAILVDKRIIHSPELKSDKNSFYNFMIKELLTHSNGTIINANIYLDGHEDKIYKRAARTYFRKQLSSQNGLVKKLEFVDSKKNNLIQAADMIVSSIARSKSDKNDAMVYKNIFSSHIEDLWNFR